tara:strand:+ start:335 stop:850 length:516 start_codon:yes stop_codon:yes gene_type:complete
MNKAIFLDRDGILNELVCRDGGFYSPRQVSDFKISLNSADLTSFTKSLGYLNIVVSNQPDISRGLLSKSALDGMTDILLSKLTIDDIFYCIHDDSDFCECRKPLAGLFFDAAKKWQIDLNRSYMIGDNWKDIEAAKKANIDSFLLDTNYNQDYFCEYRVNSLKDFSQLIGE